MKKFIVSLIFVIPSFATINQSMQWDVRQTGSDSNSGGFDPFVTSPGTDYSQQNSPQITYTDIVVGAITSTYTSTLNVVSSTLPGNTLKITGGTGCTTGVFEILSNSTITATVDRSLGTAASVCTGVLGGSLLTLGTAFTRVTVAHQNVWVCGSCGTGTFTITSELDFPQDDTTVWGYTSIHNDCTPVSCNKPTIQSSTAGIKMFNAESFYITLNYLNILANIGFSQYAILVSNGDGVVILNSKMTGNGASTVAAVDGYNANYSIFIINTEISNWNWGIFVSNGSSSQQYSISIIDSYVHGNTIAGITDAGNNISASFQWISNNTVWDRNGYGMYMQANSAEPNSGIIAISSIFSNSTNDGINNQSAFHQNGNTSFYSNSIFYANGGYGVNTPFSGGCPLGGSTFGQVSFNNGVGSNTSGNYNCVTSPGDVALTADPFVSSSTGNFALNSTSGGGAALKAVGFPGITPMGTGHLDIGTLQSLGGSTGSAPHAYVQ